MEFIIPYVLVGVFGFWVGWFVRELVAIHRLKGITEELEGFEDDEPDQVRISIEKVNDTYFVYNTDDNNSFMAQGNTRKELEDALRNRFPDTIFACPDANLKEVGFK